MKLSTQAIEQISRAWLEAQLIKRGLEVARPTYDKGIDLIAFSDTPRKKFHSVPIQIKAATSESFTVLKSLMHRGIVMAYIWHVQSANPELLLILHDDAAKLLPRHARESSSWKEAGKYSYSRKVSNALKDQLQKYQDNFGLIRRCAGISN